MEARNQNVNLESNFKISNIKLLRDDELELYGYFLRKSPE